MESGSEDNSTTMEEATSVLRRTQTIAITKPSKIKKKKGVMLFVDKSMSKAVNVNKYDEVYPGIILGDQWLAREKQELVRLGITHVVNTAQGEAYFMVHTNLAYYADIGRVYVHCFHGISRSSSVVLAFLMLKRHLPLTRAIKQVRERRPIKPNEGFMRQLVELNNKLYGPKKGRPGSKAEKKVVTGAAAGLNRDTGSNTGSVEEKKTSSIAAVQHCGDKELIRKDDMVETDGAVCMSKHTSEPSGTFPEVTYIKDCASADTSEATVPVPEVELGSLQNETANLFITYDKSGLS